MVSIGDGEKLTKFLDLNPNVPKDIAFVDDSDTFDVYEAANFGVFTDTKLAKGTKVDIKAPDFSAKQWWGYFTNVAKLAPVKKGEKLTGVPEGVLRLGGTFVIDGEDVVYAHRENLPGMSPKIEDVATAGKLW
ncbi:uncharacterized protein MICPUCDRAFT_60349 [Micromonas pusilla CCMP1545]|uniref:Predicted protein n=1 Tax=Micromonas pusilla (strain CCMP1545) TaxID=564608 RepID=C1MY01_MICPC|nr:uncharacterized protein MICPUCDRAFT_60349 [Micromonas pusilla CCMP1545]EEH55249.1 predicted protein [Micromonas pusilla CCMP1545]|mmetsp:Transcript_9119/g.33315  ORF Transcript_9119/g.33315 Transcript_9119/m.33315 type:complete len:133 (-) Transcript_9119:291-689(-)|eukprot:XP_003060480.1 predicted protein [Micromonas pusilla CCMP1545]